MNIWEKLEFKSYLLVDPSILLRWNDRLEYVLGAGTIERILCKFNHFDRDKQFYLIGVYLQFFSLHFFYITLHVHGAKFFVVVRQNFSF